MKNDLLSIVDLIKYQLLLLPVHTLLIRRCLHANSRPPTHPYSHNTQRISDPASDASSSASHYFFWKLAWLRLQTAHYNPFNKDLFVTYKSVSCETSLSLMSPQEIGRAHV